MNDALREQKEFLSKTHLCFYRDRVAGFISMAADSLQGEKLNPRVYNFHHRAHRVRRYEKFPTIPAPERISIFTSLIIVVSVRSSSVRSVTAVVYSRKPPVLRHGQHALLNIEGDLPIKNGLAERMEGENCSLHDQGPRG